MSALGPKGLAVLSIAGIAGLFLGILGWTQRDTGMVAPLVTPSATPSAAASPSPAASPSAAAGPALTSQPYASYAYQVWPGPLTADAKLAMSGFVLTVTRQATGITVNATQDGQQLTAASHFYSGGATVYVLDANLADDAGRVAHDETGDGLVVTNARGQVLS